jgi:hypothetical protein
MEDPNQNASKRRFLVKEEVSSPDIAVPSRPSFGGMGKPSDGEGGPAFRCEPTPISTHISV